MPSCEGVGFGNTSKLKPSGATSGTLMTMRMTLPNEEARKAMLASGMEHGMEAGYVRLENIVAALQRGARHFVQKPVKPEVLYEVIKYVLGEDGAVANAAGAGV